MQPRNRKTQDTVSRIPNSFLFKSLNSGYVSVNTATYGVSYQENKEFDSLSENNPDISRLYQSKHSFFMMNAHRKVCLNAPELDSSTVAQSRILFGQLLTSQYKQIKNILQLFKNFFFNDVLGTNSQESQC